MRVGSVCTGANDLDCRQLFLRDAARLCPLTDFVLFVDADARSILSGIDFGDARGLATLTRAGLLRDIGGGRHAPTEAVRRYGEAVCRRPPLRG